jgi:hypothetical protein
MNQMDFHIHSQSYNSSLTYWVSWVCLITKTDQSRENNQSPWAKVTTWMSSWHWMCNNLHNWQINVLTTGGGWTLNFTPFRHCKLMKCAMNYTNCNSTVQVDHLTAPQRCSIICLPLSSYILSPQALSNDSLVCVAEFCYEGEIYRVEKYNWWA